MGQLVFAWWPAFAYMALIFAVSSIHVRVPNFVPSFQWRDKVVHFFEYGVLGALVFRGVYLTWPRRPRWRVYWTAVFFTTMWGVSDEIHQVFVPGRSAEALDVMADFLGALVGAFLSLLSMRFKIFSRFWKERESSPALSS